MNGVKEHYAGLLGGVYAWSVAGAGDPFERAAGWLAHHRLTTDYSYLDLGAGFGAHVLPLARAGKRVTAVDFDPTLLGQLRSLLGPAADRVDVHQSDLLDFLGEGDDASWDVIMCLGDTLTHLPDPASVVKLFVLATGRLSPGGRLALAYRDYSRPPADDLARFIPVARDKTRTMHCFVEALDAERLRVTDIVTDLTAEGPQTRLGSYTKLRLAPQAVARWAEESGLTLDHQEEERGMVTQVFTS